MPDPIVDRADGIDPEHEALLADSVGLALLVVLETLTVHPSGSLRAARHVRRAVRGDRHASWTAPRRRHASWPAGPGVASAARPTTPDADLSAQWEVIDAFLAAARDGDFDALVAMLDPDVCCRADGGLALAASRQVRGAETVARVRR